VNDIERVARFYLRPDGVSIVLVGNAAAFAPQLRDAGFGRHEVISLEDLDLLTADFRRARGARGAGGNIGRTAQSPPALVLAGYRPPAQTLAAEEGSSARALLERAIEAKGGLAILRGIRTIKAVTAATMAAPGGAPGGGEAGIEAQTTTYLQYPDQVRVETRAPQGLQIQVYDGERGWVRDPGGVHDVPADALRDMETNLRRDTVSALLAAHGGVLRARLLPDVRDADGVIRHALELSSPTLDPMVLYVDPQTGLIAKQAYVVRAPGQPLIEEIFSDYRRVDGVHIAFSAEVRADGKVIVTRRLSDIVINAPLDPRLFTRPSS